MDLKNSIACSISCLLFGGGPFTVHRPTALKALFACSARIISLGVNSINGFIGWALPHIVKKFNERRSPTVTHKFTPCAIAMVLIVFNVVASLFSQAPTGIRPVPFSHLSRSMAVSPFQNRVGSLKPFRTEFVFPASARDSKIISYSSRQFGLRDCFSVPSVAYTKPESAPDSAYIASFGFFNNCELSNFLSTVYNRFSHGILTFIFNAVISRASETPEAPAILSNLFPRHNHFEGPNCRGEWFPHGAILKD